MTNEPILTGQCDKCWADGDLPGLGRRIADMARGKLEARDRVWVHLPSFREAVTEAAVVWLRSAIQHERLHGPACPGTVKEAAMLDPVSNADELAGGEATP